MNWGTKLTVGMVLFMGFIVTLVVLMIKPNQADSLIENDYYEKGQSFDSDFNASRDASADRMVPAIKTEERGLSITFTTPARYEIILRRLADAKLDQTFKSDSQQAEVFIPASKLKSGSWLLRIQYQSGGKDYLYQDKILVP